VIGLIDLQADDDTFNYRLAFQNSYNKYLPLALVGGSSVMICSNGMILGDSKFIRKHTGSIMMEMEGRIETVIGGLDNLLKTSNQLASNMQEIELNDTTTAELCGRLFMEQDIINSTQLNIIRRQLDEPDYDAFTDPTLWSLYNHTTHALKETYALDYTKKHKQLQEFVAGEFGFDNVLENIN